jgi:hypothetical protein
MEGRSIHSIRKFTLVALEVVGLGAFVYFVGGFSLRGTIAIISLLGLVWLWHTESLGGIRAVYNLHSTPYTVWIRPSIPRMLYDLGIVPPDWEPPHLDSGLSHAWTPLHLLYGGIRAVVLSSDTSAKLVHWTGPNYYTKGIEYEETLEFLKFPHPVLKDQIENSEWSPEFFFRSGASGFEIGIRVLGRWWDDNKESLEKKGIVKSVDTCDEADAGRTRITFAVLPHSVVYPFDFKGTTEKGRQKLLDEIKKELPLAGWKVDAPWNPWGGREIGTDGQADYTCNYAEVSLRLVE